MRIEDIEHNVKNMDETYDANFGDWIRNEENVRIVAHNLKKYVKEYSTDKFIVVLKYIVKDWTLRSIIVLVKKLFEHDMYEQDTTNTNADTNAGDRESRSRYTNSYAYKYESKKINSNMIVILQGLVYTWNSIFVSEFVVSMLKNKDEAYKVKFCSAFFDCFDKQKTKQILAHMESKIDTKVKETITNSTNKKAMSKKLTKAYRIS